MNKTLKKNSSFTLIELLVVIVIIGILAGLVTIAATSFINNSHNARMVAELAGISKKLIGETEFPRGNFCMEDGSNEAKKLLDFLEMEKAPEHPLYKTGETHLTTNECFLYFSDGEHYSIRVPTVGNKGYLIQESRNPNPQGIQEKCEEGWIPFGNRCVMKYEAKAEKNGNIIICGSGGCDLTEHTAVSVPNGNPWWRINQYKAKVACESIGAHLITNAEWMAIARDIESVDSNWNKTTNELNRGNSDSGKTLDGTDEMLDQNGGWAINKRTHTLSNGQVIWDIAGNVEEWVDEIIPTQAGIIGGTNGNYSEINGVDGVDWENSTNPHISYTQVGPKDQVFTSSNGVGKIWKRISLVDDYGFVRGGYRDQGVNAGVFCLSLGDLPLDGGSRLGFRCVR
jgi:prepilin-type N-terminal cleavage/methylation domain-containing protein